MKNIVLHLGSSEFPRIRVGCKPDGFRGDLVDYVLSDINFSEFENAIDRASNAVISFIKGDNIDVVMNKFNGLFCLKNYCAKIDLAKTTIK